MDSATDRMSLTSAHWGTYRVERSEGVVTAIHPFEKDPDPSPIGMGVDVLQGPTRITAPMIRKGWLEGGPGSAPELRGRDTFVQVSWDEAERLVAEELERVRRDFGNEAIFGGSYGWSSAGRFHHAQSQLHRFLNCIGGYTRSVNTYSFAAGEVIVPHVLGGYRKFIFAGPTWQSVIDNAELLVAFGGVPLKNGQISQGGVGRHEQRGNILAASAAGVHCVNVSPIRADMPSEVNAEWLAARPSTDAAILMGLAHTLIVEGLHDVDFLDTYTSGFDRYAAYLNGSTDGVVKSADWAGEICGLPGEQLRELARRMASSRTMLSVSWSLTRQDHGEQPYWAAIALASMLGQIGLPGQGLAFGFSAVNSVGSSNSPFTTLKAAALPQGMNGVDAFIPVARISDLLLNPGEKFDYDGVEYTYPEIKIVYWAGGNPFHHHQDLAHMQKAWQRPDTIITNEWCWNANAKHADIVLPSTTSLERSDISVTSSDPFIIVMDQAVEPPSESRDDYDIFRGLAREMGVEAEFSEGRDAKAWIEWLYSQTRKRTAVNEIKLPTLDQLRRDGFHEIVSPNERKNVLAGFRADPVGNPLRTPSGKIELFSEVIDGFGYPDCVGHPAWYEPYEWLGGVGAATHPLHLISNQPTMKLHSQLDHGERSRALKVDGREVVTMHPTAAATRNISTGDVVRVFNARGACFGSALVDDSVHPEVVQLPTGAWYDPVVDADGFVSCAHGNPNALTRDKGTSRLAQGPTAHTCLVEVERFDGDPPPVRAFEPPTVEVRPPDDER